MTPKPRLLVSACLLGEAVRFDGGHRRSVFVASLGAHVDLVPVCPEVEAGLGTPRPSLRLVTDGRLRMVSSTGADETARVQQACTRLLDSRSDGIDGALLKKGSPSCGPERVKIYGTNGMPLQSGRGLFADLAHSPRAYRDLGRLVAEAVRMDRESLRSGYIGGIMAALANPITRGRHANVLQHMAGYVSRDLDRSSRHEMQELIAEFASGLQPLAAPRALLQHHLRRHEVVYLQRQVYLRAYPKEIAVA